jgi:putative DNA primase/helicase
VSITRFHFEDEPHQPARPLRKRATAMPFPLDYLPDIVLDAVLEAIEITQAPPALVGSSALAAISGCSQHLVSVRRDAHLYGPIGLFILIVARSGERKSTVDKLFTKAIREWEVEQLETVRPLLVEYAAALKNWEAVDAGLRDAQRKAAKEGQPDPAIEAAMVEHESQKPQRPRVLALMRGDDTPEAFAAALEEQRVVFCVSSEAGLVFGSPGMSADAIMRNLAQYNTAWDGARIQRARTTGQNVDVEGMRVTICWQAQPDVLSAFIERSGNLAKGMGFSARFLMCEPISTQGDRPYAAPPEATPGLDKFQARVKELLNIPRQFVDGALHTEAIEFSPDAREIWTWFHDKIEAELGENCRYYAIQEFASKAAEHAARLAACLAVFAYRTPVIEVEAAHAGAAIAQWFLDENLRIHDHTLVSQAVLDAERLERRIAEILVKQGRPWMSVGELLQNGPGSSLRKKEGRDAALDVLEEFGRAKRFNDGKRKLVGLPLDVYLEWCDEFGIKIQAHLLRGKDK